jgi:Domain of unknown function (DUF932)
MQTMTLEQIRRTSPSVFAERPWDMMSAKYRFFPTVHVVEGLMAQGFLPVRAQQSRTRLPDKGDFTKHLLRFRHASMTEAKVDSTVPEIVLINSHDGTSAYRLSLGLFRVRCTNGLVVKSAEIEDIRVRHSGRESLIQDVIEGSYRIIEEAPKALAQVEQWQHLSLTPLEQEVLAEAALELRESALAVEPRALLAPRRWEDGSAHEDRDLWRTMNVTQENLMRGGVVGHTGQGQRRRLRSITSVDADTKLNRALWVLTERMAALKA